MTLKRKGRLIMDRHLEEEVSINMIALSKSYAGLGLNFCKEQPLILKNVSGFLTRGKIYGIIGNNGAGKSTLLRIINGSLEPTYGYVNVIGKSLLLNISGGINPHMTMIQNINNKARINNQKFSNEDIDKIIDYSELSGYENMKVSDFSNGMKARLGFAISICLDCDILLIDETFAVGDKKFQEKCKKTISELKNEKLIVICSHSESIVSICGEMIYL